MTPHSSTKRSQWTRRDVLRFGAGLVAASCLAPYRALAAAEQSKVKITRIQAMAIRNIAGNCLIRIDTDQGLSGYGEAGATGPMARARIETMKNLLIGRDPLTIEVHFHNMTTLMHTYMAHIQYSDTLTAWTTLLVTNEPMTSFPIFDQNATNTWRFYRIVVEP